MEKKLEEVRAELEGMQNPTGWQRVALGAVITALDNLRWHEENMAGRDAPRAPQSAPAPVDKE